MKNLRKIEKVDAFSSVMHFLYITAIYCRRTSLRCRKSVFFSVSKFAQVHSSTLISLYKKAGVEFWEFKMEFFSSLFSSYATEMSIFHYVEK